MKKQLLFLAMQFIISTLFTQGYSKGDWQFWPVLSFGTNMDITKFENMALTGNAGLFANYALSDVTLGIIEAKYELSLINLCHKYRMKQQRCEIGRNSIPTKKRKGVYCRFFCLQM